MFLIDRDHNTITELDQRSFSELGFRERDHLQEWIAKNPSCLGEELLIIQKEFAGFDETRERLDLLALDKAGNLVVIENKLDDSGRDVVWQALKYASYCSSLTTEHIRRVYQEYLGPDLSAEELLAEFFDQEYEDLNLNPGYAQRLILIAANFRKEVTSTVMWLLNHGITVHCFRVTPYAHGESLYLNVEQIIPIRDAEEFMIGMAEKAHLEQDAKSGLASRHKLRRAFWTAFLDAAHARKVALYSGRNTPSTDNWLSAGSGISGIQYLVRITGSYLGVELNINAGTSEHNTRYFEALLAHKTEIEETFDGPIIWENKPNLKSARLHHAKPGDIFNKETWPKAVDYLLKQIEALHSAVHPHLAKAAKQVKRSPAETGGGGENGGDGPVP